MHKVPLKEQKLIRILSGQASHDGFEAEHDYGSVNIPWRDITHIMGVRMKKDERIPYILFFVQDRETLYYIEANSFNYKLFLKDELTHKRETNFFMLAKKILSFSLNAYIDWPLRDSLKGGLGLLPEFSDLGRLTEYCNEKRAMGRETQKNEAPSEDSPIVIFKRKLEIFISRRKEALRYFSRAHSYLVRTQVERPQATMEDKIEQFRRAVQELEHSLQVDPYLLPSYLALGETHQNLGEDEKAIEYFQSALSINPALDMRKEIADLVFLKGLSVLYEKLGKQLLRRWAIQKYLGLFPQGRDALQYAKSLSEDDLVNLDWYYNYADAAGLQAQGDLSLALSRMEVAIGLYPTFRWCYHGRGKILRALKRYEESEKSFEIANSICHDAITDMEISSLLLEEKKTEEGEEILRKLTASMPGFYLPYASLGKMLFYEKRSSHESFDNILYALERNPAGGYVNEMELVVTEISEAQKRKRERAAEIRKEWSEKEVIDKRYRIDRVLKGGMGVVYIVTDLQQSRLYAMKSFQEKFQSDRDISDMFTKEAEVWVKLGRHRNIVQAEQVKNFEGKPHIFLEYVDGTDLEKLIKEGPLKINLAVELALQFCEGMSYAYRKLGIIHQDIKPSNCLITKEGVLKITDFGLAKIFSDEGRDGREKMARSPGQSSERAAGTLPYMSPEQLLGNADISTATDIYCFGAMLYEMLVGIPPFGKDEIDECINGHLYGEPPDPCRSRDDILRELGDIVLKCLEKDPRKRFQSFEELLQVIRKFYESNYGFSFRESTPSLDVTPEDIVSRGESLMALERYREALVLFDEILKGTPLSVRALIDKGECLYKLAQFQAAIKYLEKASDLEPRNAIIWYHRGNVLMSSKSCQEAMQCYDKALEIDQEQAETWSKKGMLFDIMGKNKEALRCCERSIKINPRLFEAWNNKGNLLTKIDRLEEAIECYEKALEINPRYLKAWYNKGILLQKLNYHKEAIESFKRVTEFSSGSSNAWIGSGISFFKLGQIEQALLCYDKALSIEPGNFQLMIFKGNCLYEMGRLEESASCFGKALKLNSRNIQAWISNGLIMGELSFLEQAILCYNKALDLNPHNEFVIKALQRLKRDGEKISVAKNVIDGATGNEIFEGQELEVGFESFEKAIQHHSCLLEVFPRDPKIWYRKGILLSLAGNDSEAMECFEKAAKIDPDYRAPKLKEERMKYSLIKNERGGKSGIFDRFMSRDKSGPIRSFEEGIRFFEKGELRFALKCFQDTLRGQPDMVEAWRYSCATLSRLDHLHDALDCATKGLARAPLSPALWIEKGDILGKMGRVSDALDAYEIAIKIFPWNYEYWMKVIFCLENVSQHSFARDYALKALYYLEREYKKGSREPKLFRYKAMLSMVLERYLEAIIYLDKLLQGEPDNPGILSLRGNALLRLGHWDEALKSFERAAALNPYSCELMFCKALCLKELGIIEEALETLDRLLELDPGFEYAWYFKGIIFSEEGDRERGLHFVSQVTELMPHSSFIWGARGVLLFSQSKERDALWCLDKAIELNPQDLNFWLNKGVVLNKLNRPEEAVYCFERILEIDCKDQKIWYFKGLAHFLMKNWALAIECCNNVLEINPRIVDAWMLKGASLYRNGKFTEALQCFDRALEVDPERAETWNNRGVLLRSMDKPEEAIKCYNKALEVEPRFAIAWFNKGRWLSELNRFNEAVVCYERVLELAPDNAHAWLDMGHCHYALERYNESLRCYDRSIKLNPALWECWESKGLVLLQLNRLEESLFCLEKAIEISPGHSSVWINKGLTLLRLNRKEEALSAFERCLMNDGENEVALYNKIITLKKMNKAAQAEICHNRLLEINPAFSRSGEEDLLPALKRDFGAHSMVESKRDHNLFIKKPPHFFASA